MIDIDDLAAQVQRNCRISDALFWGYHSVCGLLLRLRELYKWEHGMEPWDRPPTAEVLPWIGEREKEWEALEGEEPAPLRLGGKEIDPYDTEAVNALVSRHGYCYAAGRGLALKPLFILGEVADRRCVDGRNVVVLGRELVRDLSPFPAMSRDGLIVVRRDALRWYLWQRIEEAGTKPDRSLAAQALADEGVDLAGFLEDPASHSDWFDGLVRREEEVVIRHETGELREEEREGGRWGHLFGHSCGAKGEILARVLKDALADTGEGGRLQYIVSQRLAGSLAFMASFSEGLHRRLLPELEEAYRRLKQDGDWDRVEEVRASAHRRLREFVEPLMSAAHEELTPEEAGRRIDDLEDSMLGKSGGADRI